MGRKTRTTDPIAVSVPFSQSQIAIIWPGLDFVLSAYRMRQESGTVQTAYPFRIYPLPRDFDPGTFSSSMMDQFDRLSAKLKPHKLTGGEFFLTAFEFRAAAFSARTTVKLYRFIIRDTHRSKAQARRQTDGEKREIQKKAESRHKVVKVLDLFMKRATRRYLAARSSDEFKSLSRKWQSHLRWIQFHLTFFKSTRSFLTPMRKTYQDEIDRLVKMAEEAIVIRKYQLPDPAILRQVIRRFVAYSRRARIAPYHHRYMLDNNDSRVAQARLFEFLEPRLYLRKAK
jgi:hypothetical protein